MRVRPPGLIMTTWLLWVLVGCGGGGGEKRTDDARDAAGPAAADSAGPGRVAGYPGSRFSIFWPRGCDGVVRSDSGGATELARREVVFTCRRQAISFSVRHLEVAHDREGNPAHPRLVVALIEEQLAGDELRAVHQRPLKSGQIQGVDVHAEGRDSGRRAWLRGLLVGHDVYLLTAEGAAPDLFDRTEVQDFFNSFHLGG